MKPCVQPNHMSIVPGDFIRHLTNCSQFPLPHVPKEKEVGVIWGEGVECPQQEAQGNQPPQYN